MVETTRLHSDAFLSNSDKHRGTHFPSITSDDVCLETGIDVGDGTHIVYKPGIRHSSYTYSISQRYPDEWFGGRFVLYPPYYRSFMESARGFVSLHLEETASACT